MSAYHVPREYAMGGSYVDETLFGDTRAKKTAARRRAGRSLVGQTQDVAKITRHEYEAIKKRANAPLLGTEKPVARQQKQHRVPIKPLHKNRPTPEEEYNRQYRETVGTGGANIRAYRLRNDELDEVKELRSHLQVMQVKAEVDEAVKLKQKQRAAIDAYERQKDAEMERLRVEGLRRDAQKQQKRREATKAAQQKLQAQVARNHELQLLEEERLAQENLQMRRHLEHLEEQDRKKKAAAEVAKAKRNRELAKANKLAESYRIMEQERDAKEDEEIARYIKRKAAREEFRRQQAEKLRQEEELAVARMLALQEKQQDKTAEEDQKKAIRYQEQRQLRDEANARERDRKRRDLQEQVLQELEVQRRRQKQMGPSNSFA